MTKYREILRLTALGLSQRDIIQCIGVSQKTVVKIQHRAQELKLAWPLDEKLTDAELGKLMFPKETTAKQPKKLPDFDYIQKELLRKMLSTRRNDSGLALERLSTTTTECPAAINSINVCEPMKPAPPVTRIFIYNQTTLPLVL